ncbi:hypothetical protein CCAX7_20210 [Capsulimonas corticalis]|uniref:PPi-type phosphoenolpyruvate carboxykinase lobe 2 domain-containing protein n=1 Tax=Capsulimonas corticalis TaxID=2219043 RepID=A0A402D2L1_9BACT|nr:hypothetical protein [Capsulimonas corticalis]BDI29970.1 hypothetical protein CCAX7_20210 [Capsulimonas corticalis]
MHRTHEPGQEAPPASRNGAHPNHEGISARRQERIDYITLKLQVAGERSGAVGVPREVVAHLRERVRLSYGEQSPLTARVQKFLDRYLSDLELKRPITLPGLGEKFVLDRSGMASELSLPERGDLFESNIVSSYRLLNDQGALHNPKSDRRTTQGVFHVAEGGLPIPEDKSAVPKETFVRLLASALNPPSDLLRLPFTADDVVGVETFVSLMLRPIVAPSVPGVSPERKMEVMFLAPGNLTSNLDFVERIFGNAGDPHLPENDAGLDIEHWTGHTGYIILAPHLPTLTKKSLGLPHVSEATDRQKRDRMCWENEEDRYNNGDAFKVTARDAEGVMLTVIADNYYGYCKKEVKTQISFAANLLGMVEEEHAGGAIVYPQYDLGRTFRVSTHLPRTEHSYDDVVELYGETIDVYPQGYAIDREYSDLIYVPEDVTIDLDSQTVRWESAGAPQSLPLDPKKTYMVPSGFKVRLEKDSDSGQWRLIGASSEGTFCHKPSTVSGGGKSEISKSISDAIVHGPLFIADFEKDMDAVAELLARSYGDRFRSGPEANSRPILSPERSLGSVIKLFTRSRRLYTDEYNAWLDTIPYPIKRLVYAVKRLYQPEMGDNWREHFSVDVVNGSPGNELRFHDEKLVIHSMRVGFTEDGKWRMFTLRSDFVPAAKLQQEDDISASIVVPSARLAGLNPKYAGQTSYKLIQNAERRFFQRPDDAIHRGYDKFTEAHFAQPDNFFSNFAPLTGAEASAMLAAPITFAQFTPPMQAVIEQAAGKSGYFVSSANPRIVDGKPTKNPRYLQMRPDLIDQWPVYLSARGARLHRKLPVENPVHTPVNAVLPGRRLNPPDAVAGIRSLSVYNPIHYQETPELFMELISSLTGKSPSTTGAGSEGALTKGPFNALPPIIDLNNAFVSHVLTGVECFVTAAGYVGPHYRVDHDVSLLIPEVWSRMDVAERDPKYLIENNFLEKCDDFEYEGRTVQASRLGYRITAHFARTFFGIVFDNPNNVFTPEMLRPETQDLASVVDGVDNIVETQKLIAENYFADGSVEHACPPLKALLHIMRDGEYEGRTVQDPTIRAMFTRDSLLRSNWYHERLLAQQAKDARLWESHLGALQTFLDQANPLDAALSSATAARLEDATATLALIESTQYLEDLRGSLGVDPFVRATG